jgi:hypothetical protein
MRDGEVVKRRVWLEWVLNGSTALLVAVASYFLVVERVVPALRDARPALKAGDSLTQRLQLRALGAAGERAGMGAIMIPGPGPALLLVFSSMCPACYANLAAWREILKALHGSASAYAVALEDDLPAARAYAGANLPGVLAVRPADPRRFVDALGVRVVPLTALIDAEGVVRFMARGRLDSTAVARAIGALGALSGSSIH